MLETNFELNFVTIRPVYQYLILELKEYSSRKLFTLDYWPAPLCRRLINSFRSSCNIADDSGVPCLRMFLAQKEVSVFCLFREELLLNTKNSCGIPKQGCVTVLIERAKITEITQSIVYIDYQFWRSSRQVHSF